ncbi:aspartate kinase [Phytohabitans sp. LJ34]|uniref:aspartate kinase n=1 Tax=Phytohabitans sp. LJ34 TaxID=3452217 RepID=UPI003F88B62E
MNVAVQKFGGSSLATAAQLRHAAARAEASHRAGRPTVVVVSAQGDTTDALIQQAANVSATRSLREMDQLLVTGENAAAALMAMALLDRGLAAVSLTGAQAGITASGRHGAGLITEVCPTRIVTHLAAGAVVVVAGYQGVSPDGDILTLGRGGSDTTAVALAAALGAENCEIYTDVDGIYSADPRIVPSARVLSKVDAAVMAEMAFSGAHVMHARAVELAATRRLDVLVRNSMSPAPGTTIAARRTDPKVDMMENEGFVVAVTHDLDVAQVTVSAGSSPGVTPECVLTPLARTAVPVDMLSCSAELRFAVRRSDLPVADRALREAGLPHGYAIDVAEDVGKLSLVGMGLFNRPEYTARLLAVLADRGIPTSLLSSTQMRVSALVPLDRVVEGAMALHKDFDLDGREQPASSLTTA